MEQLLESPNFRFTAPFNVEVVEVKGQQKVFLEGIISSTHVDLVDDMVTKNCLDSMKKQILSKNLKLDIEHEAFRGDSVEEKELNKTKVPAGKMFDADVQALERNQFGLFVKSEVNPFNENFENIKGNLQEGFLDAYSIAFIPTRTIMKNINGKDIRLLDDVVLLNVALTGNPINTQAQNRDVFMKSIKCLEDYKKEKKSNPEIEGKLEVKSHDHISDNHSKDDIIKLQEVKYMSKEEKELEAQKKAEEEAAEEAKKEAEEVEAKAKVESEAKAKEEAEAKAEEEAKVEAEKEAAEKEAAESKEESKALKEKVESMEKEMADLKAHLKMPVRKSKSEQQGKSKDFNEKSSNPLDFIA